MSYINELVEEYNEKFVFNKAKVARMVEDGSFELLNFDEAKTLYKFSNRHAQVCEMFNEGLSRWAEVELMTLTKGYAVSKVREYAKSLTKVVETSGVSLEGHKALLAKIAKLEEALTAKDDEIAEVKAEEKRAVKAFLKEQEAHNTTKNELNNLIKVVGKLKARTVLIGKTLTNVFVPQSVN